MEDEWTEDPAEMNFRVSNLDAANRGAKIDRIFIFSKSKIKEFSFRKKEAWGWSPSIYAVLDNGYVYSKAKTQTSWYSSFLNILNCRKSCGNCKFNKIPRQGDITLGDFWAIENLTPDWNDGKGTSIVSINSEKGKMFFETVLEKLPKKEVTTIEKAKEKLIYNYKL